MYIITYEKKFYILVMEEKKMYAIFYAFDTTVQYDYIDWLILRFSNSLKKNDIENISHILMEITKYKIYFSSYIYKYIAHILYIITKKICIVLC